MTSPAPAGLPPLEPCPWCGKPLYSRAVRVNPLAVCVTEGCYGRKMPVVSLDVPSDVAAYNTRAPAPPTEAMVERVARAIHAVEFDAGDAETGGGLTDDPALYRFRRDQARAALTAAQGEKEGG